MKKIFLVLALLISAISMFSQVDSVWTEQRGGKFYNATLHLDQNGEGGLNYKLIGDTSALADYYGNAIKSEIRVLSNDVTIVRQYQKRVLQLSTHIADMKTKFGFSIQDTVASQIPGLLTVGIWQIEGKDIKFRKNATTGRYQYKLDTFAWKAAEILPGAIVLRSYIRTGYTEILWEVDQEKLMWKSLNGETTLKKFSSTSRSVSAPTNTEESSDAPIFLRDGTVLYNGVKTKYKNKKWVTWK